MISSDMISKAEAVEMLAERLATLQFLTATLKAEPIPQFLGPLIRELAEQPLDEGVSKGQAQLRDFALAAQASSLEEVTADLRAEYVAMFFASWRRVLAPFESVYRSEAHGLLQAPSQELARLYELEGLELQAGFSEPADHVALELAYMGYLCERSLTAARQDNTLATGGWLAKQRCFLDDHLLPWIPDFCRDLENKTTSLFYKGVASLTLEFLQADAGLLDEISGALTEGA